MAVRREIASWAYCTYFGISEQVVEAAPLETMGASVQPGDRFEVDQVKNAIWEHHGETEFYKAWAEGQAMTMEQALAEVLGET